MLELPPRTEPGPLDHPYRDTRKTPRAEAIADRSSDDQDAKRKRYSALISGVASLEEELKIIEDALRMRDPGDLLMRPEAPMIRKVPDTLLKPKEYRELVEARNDIHAKLEAARRETDQLETELFTPDEIGQLKSARRALAAEALEEDSAFGPGLSLPRVGEPTEMSDARYGRIHYLLGKIKMAFLKNPIGRAYTNLVKILFMRPMDAAMKKLEKKTRLSLPPHPDEEKRDRENDRK